MSALLPCNKVHRILPGATRKALAGLLLLAASPLAAQPQLLQNSDFENGLTHWTYPPNHSQLQNSSGRDGSKALQLTSTPDKPSPYATYQATGLKPDAVYELSAWARA